LDDEQRRALRALAAFRGSFTVAAAEAVAVTDLDTLAALLDRSLVRRTNEGRLFLLETIREFTLDALEAAGESGTAGAGHAAFYGHWLPEPWTYAWPTQVARSAIPQETENIRAAVEWCLGHPAEDGAPDTVARAAGLWGDRGMDDEAADWVDRALALASG